jgi:hypothetical protein
VGDTWKIRPYFTLSYGLHYVRDSGRTNSDLPPIPCSAIDAAVFSPRPKCQGRLLDMFGPGLGARVRQDSNNFAPQMGIAWDLFNDGKTVFRAGAGLSTRTHCSTMCFSHARSCFKRDSSISSRTRGQVRAVAADRLFSPAARL